MGRIKWLAIAFVASTLAGCPAGYVKSGSTQQSYYADMTSCMKDVGGVLGITGSTGTHVQVKTDNEDAPETPYDNDLARSMSEECMKAKGWRMVREGDRYLPFN